MNPNLDDRFDLLLTEVLQEVANPASPDAFTARLHLALESESTMSKTATLPNSILWTGQQPTSGWNLRSLLGAAFAHALAFALIALAVALQVHVMTPAAPAVVSLVEPPSPLKAPPKAVLMGGGGGQKGPTPVTRGNPSKFAPMQLNPPKAPPLQQAKINVPVTVNVQTDLKMAKSDIPQIGCRTRRWWG